MRFITEKKNNINLKLLIPIVVVVLVVIIVIASSISSNEKGTGSTKTNENKIEDKKENETKKEEETEETKDELVLLNTELKLSDICKNKAGICNTTVGEFSLGGNTHTLKINIDMADPYNDKLYRKYKNSMESVLNDTNSNAVYVDSKKINIKPFESLDKIIKIGEDHFAIGVDLYNSDKYKIIIYDKDVNFIKIYYSLHVPKQPKKDDDDEPKDYSDYFNVTNNTFMRYSCDTSKDNGDKTNQIIEKYQIIIEDGTFNEQKVLSENAYCSIK